MGFAFGNFWIVCCYFNPVGFKTKRENYELFIEGIRRTRAPHIVVECACDGKAFELPIDDSIIRIRATDAMWQKERLLNVGLSRLPACCTKLAWLDCDILFEDPDWIRRASDALDTLAVIQPFTVAARLPRQGQSKNAGNVEECRGFASVCAAAPDLVACGDFDQHGHTGYGWAARREWLDRHGFYDACMTGSGDHLMAHAMCGDWKSGCIDALLGAEPTAYRRHFEKWAEGVAADVRGSVGSIPGRVLHLWHGDAADRHYFLRAQQFRAFDFDPDRDIRIGAEGAWEWSSARTALHHWARAYFTLRNEDAALHLVHGGARRRP
jgi:hypothetical protein